MKEVNYNMLFETEREMLDLALKSADTPYNPYSNFFVGATVLSQDGIIIDGSNFENGAYGSTICAERSAIANANSIGKRKLEKVAIITRGEDFATTEPSASCGACRQALWEASKRSGKDLEVIMSNTDMSKVIVSTVRELLPLPTHEIHTGETKCYDELSWNKKRMVEMAEEVLEIGRNANSRLCSGASLYTQTGEIISASNIDNYHDDFSISAEHAAVVRANKMGARKFYGIAIIAEDKEGFYENEPFTPNGNSRQILYEVSQLSDCGLEVIMVNRNKTRVIERQISELLPMGFGPKDLGIDVKKYTN